jgi:hypothetical protein
MRIKKRKADLLGRMSGHGRFLPVATGRLLIKFNANAGSAGRQLIGQWVVKLLQFRSLPAHGLGLGRPTA